MLFKLFGQKKHDPPPRIHIPVNPTCDDKSSALKIIHAGGVVERYYMAVPAGRIMEKHPRFILARPEVFRRPWDSVVQPEEILIPGEKYFIVPARTLKKLRRRIRKPTGENAYNSIASSESSIDVSKEDVVSLSSKSFLRKGFNLKAKIRPVNSQPRFGKKGGETDLMEKKGKAAEEGGVKKSSISSKLNVGKKKERCTVSWEPSLTVIDESHSSDE